MRLTFYLGKRAASEEVEQLETLTGCSYTDLRRQDRDGGGEHVEGDRMDDVGPSDKGREWKKQEKRGTSTRLTLFKGRGAE